MINNMNGSWRVHVSEWYDMSNMKARLRRFGVYASEGGSVQVDIIMSKIEIEATRSVSTLEDEKARSAWLSIFELLKDARP